MLLCLKLSKPTQLYRASLARTQFDFMHTVRVGLHLQIGLLDTMSAQQKYG